MATFGMPGSQATGSLGAGNEAKHYELAVPEDGSLASVTPFTYTGGWADDLEWSVEQNAYVAVRKDETR